ncbi:MAG: hypothetical protein HY738_06600 [Bacteroidia bacterium]|nr:hypothetical protein [Bacteroidia bacterium]
MKLIISLLVLVLFVSGIKAQFYIEAGGGYGFKAFSENYLYYSNYLYYPNSFRMTTGKLSLGQGYKIKSSLGYKFTGILSAGVDIMYIVGQKEQFKSHSLQGRLVNFTPFLSASLLSYDKKLIPYIKLGPSVGKAEVICIEEYHEVEDLNWFDKYWRYYGSYSYGFNISLGISWNIWKNLSVFMESDINIISYYPLKGKLYKEEGIAWGLNLDDEENDIQSKVPWYKEIVFVNNPQTHRDSSRPQEKLRQKYPFNNWGVNTGIRFYPDFKTYASKVKKIFIKHNKTENI